jgi:hypothetical protein
MGYLGLRGGDSYRDFNLLKTILNNHSFSLGQKANGWPMLHIFSAVVSLLTEIEPLIIAKYLPSFISSIIVLPIYLLAYKIYNDKQVALLSCLVYGTIPQFMIKGLFTRETFSLFIMILFFYIIYVYKKRRDYRYTFIFIPFVPVIVFGHHLTSMMFIFLLSIYIFASRSIPYIYRKKRYIVKSLTGRINIEKIYLMILIAVLAYWVYHAVVILERFTIVFYDITGSQDYITFAEKSKLSSPIITLRGNIVYYGFFIFNGLFTLILITSLIVQKNKQKIEDLSFMTFLFLCFFFGFITLYIIGSLAWPHRYLSFGWMFGTIPLVAFILNLKKDKYKKLFIILLASFLLYNMYNIDPTYYTGNASITGVVTTEKGYNIAERINFSYGYYGYIGVNGAIYDTQGIVDENITDMEDFSNSSKMAIIYEEKLLQNIEPLKKKSYKNYKIIMEIISYKNQKNIDKIYDLGNRYIIKS